MLHLPEDESIVLSGPAVKRLIAGGDGDASLLYLLILQNKGAIDAEKARAQFHWPQERFQKALDSLSSQDLVHLPREAEPPPQPPQRPDSQRPEYTRADLLRAMEGQDFSGLTRAVEDKLGKKLTTPDLDILLGLYDFLGLPSDVIYLLVSFCGERTALRYGPGRQPTLRQIEKEGYLWARLGLLDQESAAAYIKQYHRSREALPRLMRLLRLGQRRPAPTEEKYLLSWERMGFEDGAIELAYDKTVLKCKELKWSYMNKILHSWHEKGLHTLAQIQAGDKRQAPPPARPAPAAQENAAQMEKYRRQLLREMEDSE